MPPQVLPARLLGIALRMARVGFGQDAACSIAHNHYRRGTRICNWSRSKQRLPRCISLPESAAPESFIHDRAAAEKLGAQLSLFFCRGFKAVHPLQYSVTY